METLLFGGKLQGKTELPHHQFRQLDQLIYREDVHACLECIRFTKEQLGQTQLLSFEQALLATNDTAAAAEASFENLLGGLSYVLMNICLTSSGDSKISASEKLKYRQFIMALQRKFKKVMHPATSLEIILRLLDNPSWASESSNGFSLKNPVTRAFTLQAITQVIDARYYLIRDTSIFLFLLVHLNSQVCAHDGNLL